MSAHTTPRSLRTELLNKLALLLGVAILPLLALLVLWGNLASHGHFLILAIAVGLDLVLLVACIAIILRRIVVQPLHALARAAHDIAAGDMSRRMPATDLRELQDISAVFDRLTSRVVDDQAQLLRVEKLASIGRLSATVAHEIGNPLGAILGHVHLLRRQLLQHRASSEELELLTAVERESGRIERIVRGLLDYARARPTVPAPMDIEEVIRTTIDLLRTQGALKEVDVSLELTERPVLIEAQSHDLEQLFVNLFINAVDAMKGRGRIVVRLERAARFTLREPATRRVVAEAGGVIEHPPSNRAQRWLEGNDAAEIAKIVVADSGPGVPAALAERIFDPFFTTKPSGKGTGLGLAIAARIVENFQGAIWVTNSREGGAAFHLLFPVVAAPIADRRPWRSPRRPTPPVSLPRVVRQ